MLRTLWGGLLLLLGGLAFGQSQPQVASLLEALETSFAKGEYAGLEDQLKRALTGAKGSDKTALQLGQYHLYRNLRRGPEMQESLAAATRDLPSDLPIQLRLYYHLSQAEGLALNGQWEGCLSHFQAAETIELPNAPLKLIAKQHFVRGKILRNYRNEITAGATAYQEALAVYAKLNPPDLFVQGDILRTLGNRARSRGDFPLSRKYYERELRSYQVNFRPTHPEVGNVHYLLGAVLYEMMDYPAALEHFLACHTIWEQEFNRPPRYKKYLYEAIGDMYWELNNRPKALEFYNRASEGDRPQSRDSSELMTAYGDSLLAVGKHSGALQFYQQALAYRKKTFGSSHRQTAVCQNFVARAHSAAGDPTQALQAYEQAIAMLSGVNGEVAYLPDLLEALAGKGELLLQEASKSGDSSLLKAAADQLSKASQHLEQLQQSPLSVEAKTYWNQRVHQLLEAGIEAQTLIYQKTREESHLKEAYLLSQKSRTFLLSTAIRQAGVTDFAGVPADLLARERDLHSDILRYEGTIQGEEKRCTEAREKQLSLWREKLDFLRTEHQLLLRQIETNYPDYYTLKYRVPVSEPMVLQAALAKQGTALIETFVGERNVYLFLLAEGQFTLHTLPVTGSFTELMSTFLSFSRSQEIFLADPAGSYQTYCQTAHELYTLLLAPLLDSLTRRPERLILVTAQELATTPFVALLTDHAEETKRNYRQLPYLGRKYAISYAPSAGLWLAATPNPQRSNSPYAGFAPDYAQVRYPDHEARSPLWQAPTEIRTANQLLGGQSYLGIAATETAFRQQSARLIHLAAHALIDEEQPLQSRILLHPADSTEDGLLHAHELYGLQLPAQLSVLGACHTAAGPYQKGEGILSLERAFQYAGCPSVVSSLWASEDAATAAINGYFLAALHQGLPKDLALQSAQLRYLETCPPGTEIPFFWSGQRLAGSTAPLTGTGWSSGWRWVAGSLLFLVAIVFWWRRRA